MTVDYHNPTFQPFPYNNNRTAWRPIGFPVIMVVPHRRDIVGIPLANSQVFNVKVLIEDVPREARVAGHDHVGLRFPDRELYAETIDTLELADRILDMKNLEYYRDGVEVDYDDAVTGDTIHYTTRTGIAGTIEYVQGANYYDLSDVLIECETLPSDTYNLVYQAEYFTRIISNDDSSDLLCIDASSISLAIWRIPIQHPGQVMDEFYRLTPPPYLSNASKAEDTTVGLYRPLTDVMQDIADEQTLLETINFVFNTPPEAIPYLSQLLGWELPYFPESLDNMRKAVLRRTVEFQNIKGSRRAIINIFRLFGFEILISNLWWSSDGQRLIRPDQNLPLQYEDQEITIQESCQIDPILSDWSDTTFGEYDIPLLFRPQEKATLDDFSSIRDGGSITLDAYLVEVDSDAYNELVALSAAISGSPSGYGDECGSTTDDNGFINAAAIHDVMDDQAVTGYSQILITGKLGIATLEVSAGTQLPLTKYNVSFNRDTNVVSITLNAIDSDQAVFIFATYKKQELVVPDVLTNLQSNRFDVTVVTQDLAEFADPVILDFAIEFLFKLKAFHSLLNVIRQRIDLTETYEVTDLCFGGDVLQRYDTDIGTLQVPPAIIPDIPGDINDCTQLDAASLGYKEADILLRTRKITSLAEELAAWSLYDSRQTAIGDTKVPPLSPVEGRTAFLYTPYGQDRILPGYTNAWTTEYGPGPLSNQEHIGNIDLSPQDTIVSGEFNTTGPQTVTNSDSSAYGSFMREYREIPVAWPELDDKTDYCYKGRVDDELLYRLTVLNNEIVRCKPCSLGLGTGVYYTMPSRSQKAAPGNRNRMPGSMSNKLRFTGNAPEEHLLHHLSDGQADYLTASYDIPLPAKKNSLLGRLYRDYDAPEPETLHYTNRTAQNVDQRYQLALTRPSINVELQTLHLPGCRFPRLNALEDDFEHGTYRARPWDDKYSTFCGPRDICGDNEPTLLNVTKTIGTDGNEYLVYDDVAYSVDGNNLVPDIPSLDSHTLPVNALFEESDVIHAIYSDRTNDSPYVTLDQLCDYSNYNTAIETSDPIFTSHNQCPTLITRMADGAYQTEPTSGARKFTAANSERFNITAPNPGTADFAFEVWFNRDSLVEGEMAIFGTGGTPGNRGFMLASGPVKNLQFYINDGTVNIIDVISPPLAYARWYHVLVTVDRNGFATCYVNGAYAGQVNVSTAYRTLGTTAGRIGSSGSTLYFDGKMACLRYYQGTLPGLDHIASMFNGGTPKKRDDLTAAERAQLVSAWDMDELSGDALDSEGTNDGIDFNTVTYASGPYLPAYDLTLVGFVSTPRSTDIPSGWSGYKSIVFDGTGYAITASSDLLAPSLSPHTITGRGARSVAFAMKIDSVPAVNSIIIGEARSSNSTIGFCAWAASNGYIYCAVFNGTGSNVCTCLYDLDGNGLVGDGQFHTFVFAWNGTTGGLAAKLYVDGSPESETTPTILTQGAESTFPFQVSGYNGTSNPITATICGVAVTAGRAWTSTEVTAYHSAGTVPDDATAFYTANEAISTDYRDGYPCISGFQDYDGDEDLGRDGLYQDIVDGLSIPTRSATDPTDEYLILLSSGILHTSGLRLDCGCLLFDCDRSTVERLWVAVDESGFLDFDHASICSLDQFYDQDGELDVNCDHLVVERIMKLEETIGTCSIRLDGTIETLLETA